MEKAVVILFMVMIVAGTVAVEFDKDVRSCVSSFESEVDEIADREAEISQFDPLNPATQPSKETLEATKDPDFPFNGSLDRILARRDALLKHKGVLMIGSWDTAIKAGMRESMTTAIYIPYKPWRLRFS